LHKAWIGYVIAKNKGEYDQQIHYARSEKESSTSDTNEDQQQQQLVAKRNEGQSITSSDLKHLH
jgi:hypothetical protein